ncbi:MAG: hypothetical protein KDC53_18715, partial [Saprospiraceae bacterium]|nr:hypothetical protein [Saprospiraceae bacterium]
MMKNLMFPWKSIWAFYFIVLSGTAFSQLSGSKLLDWEGDIASRLIDSCDAFLLKEIQKSITNRSKFWHRDMRSRETYDRSIQANREHLAQIIGIRDSRTPFDHLEKMGLVAESETYRVEAVRWPSFGQVYGEGLIVYPKQSGQIKKATIVIPDADQTPEEILGISGDLKSECQIGKLYAEDGHLVIIPILVNRAPNPMKISNREFIYRAAYELGRHIIGYEIQKILSAIDWLEKNRIEDITVSGWGEGGLLALYAGAIDTRIDLTEVSGYFGSRQNIWLEPAYRNIYGLLEEFGDAEIATMVAPRTLIVHSDNGAPEIEIKPGENKGKPGRLIVPNEEEVAAEIDRTNEMMNEWNWQVIHEKSKKPSSEKVTIIELPNITNRQQRLLTELDRHNQWLLSESPYVRAEFMAELKFDSLEAFKNSVEPYREYFAKQVIGQFDYPLSDFNVRSRPIKLKNPKLQAFEVAIDVFPGIFAYGILILPEDLHPGEQRPVVVCQHGLEGRPQSTIGDQDFKAYKAFAT